MLRKLLQFPFLMLIRIYQYGISPMLGCHCRFQPNCSEYAYQAINVHGVIKGIQLGFWRICRCQPFMQAGFDPVPPHFKPD